MGALFTSSIFLSSHLMTPKEELDISKFLSYVLRHRPDEIGLALDKNGWADVDELIEKANQSGKHLSFDAIEQVVVNSDKQRFALSADFSKIRANQGHSVTIDLELVPKAPPEILFHGTAFKNIGSIKQQGLLKGKRHHVHLSGDTQTAVKVGKRYGEPDVLTIQAAIMNEKGFKFYESDNGVWLTDFVPVEFITFS